MAYIAEHKAYSTSSCETLLSLDRSPRIFLESPKALWILARAYMMTETKDIDLWCRQSQSKLISWASYHLRNNHSHNHSHSHYHSYKVDHALPMHSKSTLCHYWFQYSRGIGRSEAWDSINVYICFWMFEASPVILLTEAINISSHFEYLYGGYLNILSKSTYLNNYNPECFKSS